MPFEVRTTTTIVHTGQPDDSIFKVHLEDGTTLVGTDRFPHYATCTLVLHPDFFPHDVEMLVDEEYQRQLSSEHTYLMDVDNSGRDPMELARSRVDRKRIDALIKSVRVGEALVVAVGKKTITYLRVTRLEGSA